MKDELRKKLAKLSKMAEKLNNERSDVQSFATKNGADVDVVCDTLCDLCDGFCDIDTALALIMESCEEQEEESVLTTVECEFGTISFERVNDKLKFYDEAGHFLDYVEMETVFDFIDEPFIDDDDAVKVYAEFIAKKKTVREFLDAIACDYKVVSTDWKEIAEGIAGRGPITFEEIVNNELVNVIDGNYILMKE